MTDLIMQKLERIESLLEEQVLLKKEVLDFNDACQYLKLSSSHMYKLTSSQSIPHFRPNGKKLYFKRSELNDWLLNYLQKEFQKDLLPTLPILT